MFFLYWFLFLHFYFFIFNFIYFISETKIVLLKTFDSLLLVIKQIQISVYQVGTLTNRAWPHKYETIKFKYIFGLKWLKIYARFYNWIIDKTCHSNTGIIRVLIIVMILRYKFHTAVVLLIEFEHEFYTIFE